MTFVDLTNFSPTDEWLYESWKLFAELRDKPTIGEKKEFIDENRDFWGTLKEHLPFNDKCWFSEAKESVSVYQIEHFRPIKAIRKSKSVLKGLKTFVEASRRDWIQATGYWAFGYWWLAFDYRNFRNCGERINLIKGNRFPLKRDSFIAYSFLENFEDEDAYLLDPTNRKDIELLTFDPDGKARPTITDDEDLDFIRAYVSIELYGLNQIDALVRNREAKWSECYKAIRRATQKYLEVEEAANSDNLVNYHSLFSEFIDFVSDIKPAIHPSSEFSAVARACVMSYSKYRWIQEYVLAA